jgi:hypothetical protein
MLLEKDIRKLLEHAIEGVPFKINFNGLDIFVKIVDDSSKICLVTSVYHGINYIPGSVRLSLSQKVPLVPPPSIRTFLTIDEQHFQVHLNYLGHTEYVTTDSLKEIVEEFGLLAESWWFYLDQNDKNDLVYVPVK